MGTGQFADQFHPLADALEADGFSFESVYHPGNGDSSQASGAAQARSNKSSADVRPLAGPETAIRNPTASTRLRRLPATGGKGKNSFTR
jgi:hypothetical protein